MYSTLSNENSSQDELVRKFHGCDFIGMMNKLQNKLAASGKILETSLPQIVVIGSQSAGKSSVLESIIRREFLPRGEGTVTRRPTIIQLHPCEEEYAIFLHKKEKFTDFEQVKKEIEEETRREPGPTGFSSKPISLTVYSPNVLKLTLVDMPGIIKNVIKNQSEDEIQEVKSMVLSYIEQPNSLILAVTQATQDIATSDALEIAKQVDPKRERTIGVVTKLDIPHDETQMCAVLRNELLPLSRGYVGVVNRSEDDIAAGHDIEYSLEYEKRWFANHKCYKYMANRLGSPYLQKVLHVELREHIKQALPGLKKELTQKLHTLRGKLKQFHNLMNLNSDGTYEGEAHLIKLVQMFKDDIHAKLFGHSDNIDIKKLSTGAIINYRIHRDIRAILKLPTRLNEEELIKLITNQHGIRNVLSIPSITLESACGEILKQYKEPLEAYVDSISDLLTTAVDESSALIASYPVLKTEMENYINESIDKFAEETKDLIGKHIKAEMMYCNIYHMDFDNGENELAGHPMRRGTSISVSGDSDIEDYMSGSSDIEDTVSTKEATSENIIGRLKKDANAKKNSKCLNQIVVEYMKVVQKHLADVVIKYIVCFLVKAVSQFIQTDLISKILLSPNHKLLVKDCERDFEIRNEMILTCTYLEETLSIIQTF